MTEVPHTYHHFVSVLGTHGLQEKALGKYLPSLELARGTQDTPLAFTPSTAEGFGSSLREMQQTLTNLVVRAPSAMPRIQLQNHSR